MLAIIKEIGIFIVIAQAILYFTPSETYVKYIKIIIGIMMIAKIAQPLLALVTEEKWQEIENQVTFFSQEFDITEETAEFGDQTMEIQNEIEREILHMVKTENVDSYEVVDVEVTGEQGKIVLVLKKKAEREVVVGDIQLGEAVNKEKELKDKYGKVLSMDADNIVIEIRGS